MLAFNFFFLDPVYTFRVSDSGNWVALVVFVFTAVVVSELAARSRRRATESALLAGMATSLLQRSETSAELDRIAAEVARVLRVDRVTIDPGTARRWTARARAMPAGRRRARGRSDVPRGA